MQTDETVRDMFNETAARENADSRIDGIMGNGEYDEFERGKILELLRSLNLDTSGRVLDAGCGIGRNVSVLKDVGFTKITGADFSTEMLKCAKESHPDVEFVEADLGDLSVFPDNHFEAAFIMYVFIHIVEDEHLQRVISELERVTRGPVIVGQVMDPENKTQSRVHKVREVFEMHGFWKQKQMDHYFENYYEFHGRNHDWTNRVSFVVYR